MKTWFSSVKASVQTFVSAVMDEEPTMVEFRGNWIKVQSFYNKAQNSENPETLAMMSSKLEEVDGHLNHMLELLVSERKEYLAFLEGEALVKMHGEMGEHSEAKTLPPCYSFLINGETVAHPEVAGKSGKEEKHHVDPMSNEGNSTNNGRELILSICQFAKHDQPLGSRSVMLRFLKRFFVEVDVAPPMLPNTTLLQRNADLIAVPVFDALLKISRILDPMEGSVPPTDPESLMSFQRDRSCFVSLVQELCSKTEANASLAKYFMVPVSAVSPQRTRKTNTETSSDPTTTSNGDVFFLLDSLVPYLYHQDDCVSELPLVEREKTARRALRGILSLAKSTNGKVREYVLRVKAHPKTVLRSSDIATSANFQDYGIGGAVILEICRALLTICKVPPNPETPLHMAIVLELTRFCDALFLTAPDVVKAWNLKSLFVDQVLQNTIAPFLRSHDDKIYISVVTMLCNMFQHSVETFEMKSCIAAMIFGTGDVSDSTIENESSMIEECLLARLNDMSDVVVRASLMLAQTLLEKCPHESMRHLLSVNEEFLVTVGDAKGLSGVDPSVRMSHLRQQLPSKIPAINVTSWFSPEIVMKRGLCGTTDENFTEEVITRMMLVEGNLDGSEALSHRPTPVEATNSLEMPQGDEVVSAYFSPSVCDSPLVVMLCEKLENALEQSFDVNCQLMSTLSLLCIMPDSRVIYTLLDPVDGPLMLSIKRVSEKISASLEENSLGGDDTATSSSSLRLRDFYKRLAERPFFDSGETNDAFTEAMRSVRPFVDGCISMEGFRHELSAAVCYVEISETMAALGGANNRN